MRFILEGVWNGYHSGQRHVVHRTIISFSETKKIADQNLSSIRFTDGSYLALIVTQAKPREKVSEIHGYDKLIKDCLFQKCNSVDKLI